MTVSEIGTTGTGTSEAATELQQYKQKLAADLAAKAATKVIDADKAAVAKAQQEVLLEAQQSQRTQQSQKTQQTKQDDETRPVQTGAAFDVTV
jgi:hypothetical protein